jgi:hypothetical protein
MHIQWNGHNAQEIASAVGGGIDLGPFALTPEVSLRQREGSFFLTLPARHGEVWLSVWDWAVKETDGAWVRLSPEQHAVEYPDHNSEE